MNLQDMLETLKKPLDLGSDDSLNILDLIREDHKPLKEFIATMKDLDLPLAERREATENFAIQLVGHAKPEEEILYTQMKNLQALRVEALEGETEHMVADQLLEEVKREEAVDAWSAKVKVLAELVEHHIREEENKILPHVEKNLSDATLRLLGKQFLEAKVKLLEQGADDAPPEDSLDVH